MRVNEDMWALLGDSVRSNDNDLFIKTIRRNHTERKFDWFMHDVVTRMVHRLEIAAKHEQSVGETLFDWINSTSAGIRKDNSPKNYDGIYLNQSHPSCTGFCHFISPTSPRIINTISLVSPPCILTLLILLLLSIPQFIRYFPWVCIRRCEKRKPAEKRDETEMVVMRRDSADSTVDDKTPLTSQPEMHGVERVKHYSGLCADYLYIAPTSIICILTIFSMCYDFYRIFASNTCGVVCNTVGVWRFFLYPLFVLLYIDMMYFYSSLVDKKNKKKVRFGIALVPSFIMFFLSLFLLGAAAIKMKSNEVRLCDKTPSLSGIHARQESRMRNYSSCPVLMPKSTMTI
ncbi:hypothetical protein PFISCL1PPCAC_24012 [Pristionchus fissidentatus]|uniref:G protein-coupled receptor n=1 Tax=Pristionchus fissidentatus TaxID=1538716 RepID=A0AAV5WQC2_9BILA|nr:hypothetical protein PFISCL1PPCAC_24012 [Pristionchus fissidentatus]